MTRLGEALLKDIRSGGVGAGSITCVVKHFPCGELPRDRECAHFPTAASTSSRAGRLEDRLVPFRLAVARGVAVVTP